MEEKTHSGEDGGRKRRDAAPHQGGLGDNRSWKRQEGVSPGGLGGSTPCQHLTEEF